MNNCNNIVQSIPYVQILASTHVLICVNYLCIGQLKSFFKNFKPMMHLLVNCIKSNPIGPTMFNLEMMT